MSGICGWVGERSPEALAAMLVLSSADGLSVYIRQALVPLVTPREAAHAIWQAALAADARRRR